MRGEPETSRNEASETFVKSNLEWHREENAANTDRTNANIFLEEVSKVSQRDSKSFFCLVHYSHKDRPFPYCQRSQLIYSFSVFFLLFQTDGRFTMLGR